MYIEIYQSFTVHIQDRVWTEVTHCPVLNCRSPMAPYVHLGVKKQRCTKVKCRRIAPTHISCYFTRKGVGHSCSTYTYAPCM